MGPRAAARLRVAAVALAALVPPATPAADTAPIRHTPIPHAPIPHVPIPHDPATRERVTTLAATLRRASGPGATGAPAYPFGLYHVSSAGARRMDGRLVEDLRAMGKAGFSFAFAGLDDDGHGKAAAAAARAAGLALVAEVTWPGGAGVTRALGDGGPPAWSVGDDLGWPAARPKLPPGDVASRAGEVKAARQEALTFGSVAAHPSSAAETAARYAGAVDVLGFQCYPFGNADFPAGGGVSACLKAWAAAAAAVRAVDRKVAVFATPQLHVVPGGDVPGRRPAPAEARALLYGAVAAGADGVLAYAYYDGKELLPEAAPALWDTARAAAAEMRRLAPFLSSPPVVSFSGDVVVGRWDRGPETVVIAVNGSATSGASVTLPSAPGSTYLPPLGVSVTRTPP